MEPTKYLSEMNLQQMTFKLSTIGVKNAISGTHKVFIYRRSNYQQLMLKIYNDINYSHRDLFIGLL